MTFFWSFHIYFPFLYYIPWQLGVTQRHWPNIFSSQSLYFREFYFIRALFQRQYPTSCVQIQSYFSCFVKLKLVPVTIILLPSAALWDFKNRGHYRNTTKHSNRRAFLSGCSTCSLCICHYWVLHWSSFHAHCQFCVWISIKWINYSFLKWV